MLLCCISFLYGSKLVKCCSSTKADSYCSKINFIYTQIIYCLFCFKNLVAVDGYHMVFFEYFSMHAILIVVDYFAPILGFLFYAFHIRNPSPRNMSMNWY